MTGEICSMPDQHAPPSTGLRPVNVLQAAAADLKLRQYKQENKADPDARYSFMSRHVRRARSAEHLIALALFEPLVDEHGMPRTDKNATATIYHDTKLLSVTLINLLQGADEDALRTLEVS